MSVGLQNCSFLSLPAPEKVAAQLCLSEKGELQKQVSNIFQNMGTIRDDAGREKDAQNLSSLKGAKVEIGGWGTQDKYLVEITAKAAYIKIFRLGEGSFKIADAYLQIPFNKKEGPQIVAHLKLKKCLREHEEVLAAFKRDCEFMKTAEGKEFIQFYDSYVLFRKNKPAKQVLIVEFCERDLDQLLKKPLIEQSEELKHVLHSVLLGMDKFHKSGNVHMDLKPENILVKESDEYPIGKLTDFGTSTPQNATEIHSFGTAVFMSPEALAAAYCGPSAIDECDEKIKQMNDNLAQIHDMREKNSLPSFLHEKFKVQFESHKAIQEALKADLQRHAWKAEETMTTLIHPKNDVWSFGLMIYKILHGNDFYSSIASLDDVDCTRLGLELLKLTQDDVDRICIKAEATGFEEKLQQVLVKTLRLDRAERPDAATLSRIYEDIFELNENS